MLFTGELAAAFKGACRNCCSRRRRGMRCRGEVTRGIPTAGKGVWICSFSCFILQGCWSNLAEKLLWTIYPLPAVPRLSCRFQTPLGFDPSEEGSPVLQVAAEH